MASEVAHLSDMLSGLNKLNLFLQRRFHAVIEFMDKLSHSL